MDIEIKPVLTGVLDYLKTSAGDQWQVVKEQALEYLDETETRLLNVSLEATTGDLSAEFLAERAKDELSILQSQALSFGIISASFSQEVINTTIQNLLITVINALTKALNDKL